jgi:hypothetical protein
VLSRVLSALGYHQPPVYYLRSFKMRDNSGVHTERGGRFRLQLPSLTDQGEWSWQQNPFVGQRPYQGLLVILLIFNSSDLKNSNNTLYEYKPRPAGRRGIGTSCVIWVSASGETGRFSPVRNNLAVFSRTQFITGERRGSSSSTTTACTRNWCATALHATTCDGQAALIGGLSDRQWRDAFRAGGYAPDLRARFIEILQGRVSDAQRVNLIASR